MFFFRYNCLLCFHGLMYFNILMKIPLAINNENVLDPIMMHNMKHEKIIPNGGEDVEDVEVKTGVHKNTKMYIQDSMILCIKPSRNIFLLDMIK